MSFVRLPSCDWVDLKLVRMIRADLFYPGGPRCTVVTKWGDITVPFSTIQEARDWMDKFGEEIARFKEKVPRSPEPITPALNYTSFRHEVKGDVAYAVFIADDGSEIRCRKESLQDMKSALWNLAFRPDHSGSALRRYIVVQEALFSWPPGK
jgi:hypothetical protein